MRNMRQLLYLFHGGLNEHRRPRLNQRLILTCAMRALHFGPVLRKMRVVVDLSPRFARLAASEERRISFHSDRSPSVARSLSSSTSTSPNKATRRRRLLENSEFDDVGGGDDDDGDDKFEGAVGNATWESCSGSERVRARGRPRPWTPSGLLHPL